MTTPEIAAGDTTEVTVWLVQEDGKTKADVSTASEIIVGLTDDARTEILAGPYTAASGHAAADWSQGKVVITVPAEDSEDLAGDRLFADAKVTIGAAVRRYFGEQLILVREALI